MANNTNEEYLTIAEAKRMLRNTGFVVADTSGPRSFGYCFGIFQTEIIKVDAEIEEQSFSYTAKTGDALASSITIFEPETINMMKKPGSFVPVFRAADVTVLL